ncbi:MAG TPA: hypothetical protein DDX71_02150 [Ruminococcus sp.]|nr:hypothetical protein [Ruminococcus sp.]
MSLSVYFAVRAAAIGMKTVWNDRLCVRISAAGDQNLTDFIAHCTKKQRKILLKSVLKVPVKRCIIMEKGGICPLL